MNVMEISLQIATSLRVATTAMEASLVFVLTSTSIGRLTTLRDKIAVSRIISETPQATWGLLHLDTVTAVAPTWSMRQAQQLLLFTL